MKTRVYILMLMSLLTLGCVQEAVYDEGAQKCESSLAVFVEGMPATRSIITFDDSFLWYEDDCIGVFGSITDNSCFRFQYEDNGVANFVGNLDSSEDSPIYTYHPYVDGATIDNAKFTFELPKVHQVTNQNIAPLFGKIQDGRAEFKYLGGFIYLRIAGVNEDIQKLVVSVDDEETKYLTGKVIVDDVDASSCTYYIENGNSEIVYDLTTAPENLNYCICYIPMPVGIYDKVYVKILNSKDEAVVEKTLSNLTVSRAHMVSPPVIHVNDVIYKYVFPQECLEDTEWDSVYVLSNDLLVMCQDESIVGSYYAFADLYNLDKNSSENTNIITARFDDSGKIMNVTAGDYIYGCKYDDEGNCEVNILSASGTLVETVPLASSRIEQFTVNVESQDLHVLQQVYDFMNRPFVQGDGRVQSTKDLMVLKSEVTEQTLRSYLDLHRAPFTAARTIVNLTYAQVLQVKDGQYKRVLGNTTIHLSPLKQIAPNIYSGDSFVTNTGNVSHTDFSYIVTGYVWRRYSLDQMPPDWRAGSFFVDSREVEIKENEDGLNPHPQTWTVEPGMCYYIRAFVGLSGLYNVYSYSPNVYILYSEYPRINTVKATDLIFTGGKFYSEVTVTGGGYLTDESTYYMRLSNSSGQKFFYRTWTAAYPSVLFEVYLNQNEVSFESGESMPWDVEALIKPRDTPEIDQTDQVIFKYKATPSLKLDVKLVGGPHTVQKTKADNDEERQYIEYQVDVTVGGGGKFASVLTSSSNGNFYKSERITEGTQRFTYTATAVFSDRSQLPTIKCEGTMMDGSKIYADREFALSSLF